MNPVIVIQRGSRRCISADEFLAELDNGSTLLFFKENRPVVTISRTVSAPQFTEPSVEEALIEPSSPHQDAEASVRSSVITPPPSDSTAEEACPEEKAMVEVEDPEEEASGSSSDHDLSPVSGSGSDSSSLTEGSSSVVDSCSGVEPSTEAAGRHQEDAHSSDLTPADGGAAPPSPALQTAEEACQSASVAPPQPQTSASSQQNNADKMEASLSSLPSLPDGSTAPVAPPQPQPSSSSQQTSADDVEDMKVETSLPSTLSPPHSPAPPPTFPPPRRRALKRPAPSSQDEMEPAAKRAKLQRMSNEVTPPPVETPSSSQVDLTKALIQGTPTCKSRLYQKVALQIVLSIVVALAHRKFGDLCPKRY
ncbi:uncharacterized protein [Misgurnus anguillicaudatus]|uniref:uncharacterized protein n=1 Tax=Misgurnus anguillicaudatus TaxID=75329 RepID=UPI003CCF4E6D